MVTELLFVTLLLGVKAVDTVKNKRILTSDPGYVHELEVKLQELEAKVYQLTTKQTEYQSIVSSFSKQMDAFPFHDIGTTYVRWGRTVCPDTADLVYTGYVGGSWYNDQGAAVNYLCLHTSPQWWNYTGTTNAAYVYGGEYQYDFHSITPIRDYEPSCSVCRTNRSSVLMMPGRIDCLGGWTKEYAGFLAAGSRNFKAGSEYVCLDRNPVPLSALGFNHNGKEFHPVGSKCGSLPCPPFVENGQMSCVVCSK